MAKCQKAGRRKGGKAPRGEGGKARRRLCGKVGTHKVAGQRADDFIDATPPLAASCHPTFCIPAFLPSILCPFRLPAFPPSDLSIRRYDNGTLCPASTQ